MEEMNNESLQWLLEIAKQASIEAGEAIKNIYYSNSFDTSLKDDDSPLTKADKISHEIISEKLAVTRYPVLSEEGQHISYENRKNWNIYWLIDPLDGTKEFVNRNGEFTVNIALIIDKNPWIGVIYVPVTNELYWASKDKGAWMTGNDNSTLKLDIKEQSDPGSNNRIVVSKSHFSNETKEYLLKFPDAEYLSIGSSLKFLKVAEGKAFLYPRFGPTMEWDTAAAQCIVEVAGGKVYDARTGDPLLYNKENLLNDWFICSW